MSEDLYSVVPSLAVLSLVALSALALTLTRAATDPDPIARRRLMRLVTLVVVLQGAHFTEELVTGFAERLPGTFGLPPVPGALFVSFNLFWIAVWGISVLGLRTPFRVVFFPIWFLALACAANGLLHPLLALVAGGYFPGLWTSPVVGIAGVQLLRRLASYTQAHRKLLLRG